MESVKCLVSKYFALLVLLVLEVLLFATNYQPNTFFLGWDNLFAEANLPANLERSFWGVWQEYRGLGLLDGMSFAANLPHYLLTFIFSLILPLNLIRYFFIFLLHLIGGVGMYVLLKKLVLSNHREVGEKTSNLIYLSGALFYQYNITTIQMFYAPYELFLYHFAFLPWLIFSLIKLFNDFSRKNIIWFFILSILSIPQAHVPTIFIVYLLALLSFLFFYLLNTGRSSIKKILTVLSIVFITNAFWGLPFTYSTLTNSQTIIDSKINQLSNENIYLKNKARGNLKDIFYLQGFMLDEVEPTKTGSIEFVMKPWRDYTDLPIYKVLFSLLLIIFLVGLWTILKEKKRELFPFTATLLIAFIFLSSDVPVLSEIIKILREQSTLFREIFRFAFTKFSILFVFSYTVILVYGLYKILSFPAKQKIQFTSVLITVLAILTPTIILINSYPSFTGNFLYTLAKVKIPVEYFQAIQYFNNQNPSSRVALLPQPTFWSWRFYSWGYRGSGFFWYGIPQATMDRAFDPWSNKNEGYFWELSNSLYSNNLTQLEKVFDKYQIGWIILDENIRHFSSPKALHFEETEKLLASSQRIKLDKSIGEIKIYKISQQLFTKDYILIAKDIPSIAPDYSWNDSDSAFFKFGNYQTNSSAPSIYYPFRSLFTGKNKEDLEFNIEVNNDSITFLKTLPSKVTKNLQLPSVEELIWFDQADLSKVGYYSPLVNLNGQKLKVSVPKIKNYLSPAITADDLSTTFRDATTCEQLRTNPNEGWVNTHSQIIEEENRFLRFYAKNFQNCSISLWVSNIPHKYSYLLSINTRNIKGRPLYFWLENPDNGKAEFETFLSKDANFTPSYFILPPTTSDGLGYTLHFNNTSLNKDDSINDLLEISFTPIPYQFLKELSTSSGNLVKPQYLTNFNVYHPNPSIYQLKLRRDPVNDGELHKVVQKRDSKNYLSPKTLILSQSFDNGWIAFYLDGLSFNLLQNHVLINNWANGWELNQKSEGKNVWIIYLPQLLQTGGLVLLLVSLFFIVFPKKLLKNYRGE